MPKFAKIAEVVCSIVIAIACVVLSLMDLLGLWPQATSNFMQELQLMATALALSTAVAIHHKCSRILQERERQASQQAVELLDRLSKQIHPELLKVFEENFFKNMGQSIKTAIEKKEVEIYLNGAADFRYQFTRMLRSHARATFWGTSSTKALYLWKDEAIKKTVTDFTKARGKIKIVFFVKNAQECGQTDIQETLKSLRESGMEVYIAYNDSTPPELRKLFIVDSKGRIGWETFDIDDEGRQCKNILTADAQAIENYLHSFKRLHDDIAQKYEPPK